MKEKDEFTGFSKKVGFRSSNLTEQVGLGLSSPIWAVLLQSQMRLLKLPGENFLPTSVPNGAWLIWRKFELSPKPAASDCFVSTKIVI